MDASGYRAVAALRDGTPVWLRAIRPGDRVALNTGFHRLSQKAVYHRFFQTKRELTEAELTYLTEVDFVNHVALVAVLGDGDAEELIGVGRFVRLAPREPECAEIAFTVIDQHHGRGVATLLLDHLGRLARGLGIRTFQAEVMPDNQQMLEVFRDIGWPWRERAQAGAVRVELDLGEAGEERDP